MPRSVRLALIILFLCAIAWHIWKLAGEWSAKGESLRDLSLAPGWLLVSAIAYAAAQFAFAAFWHALLTPLGMAATWPRTFRAFIIGTLGKYIPGKAMVVVLRTEMIRPLEAGRFPIAVSVFFETVTAMLVGCVLAGACLALTEVHLWPYWTASLAVAGGLIIALSPPLFFRAVKIVSLPFAVSPLSREAMSQWFGKLVRPPIVYSISGWLLFGASAWAVMNALGANAGAAIDFVYLTGVAALATVGGFFVLFVPGGIGVREFLFIQLLAPRYGQPQAVAASLLLRVIWTLAEVGLAGVFYFAAAPSPATAETGRDIQDATA